MRENSVVPVAGRILDRETRGGVEERKTFNVFPHRNLLLETGVRNHDFR